MKRLTPVYIHKTHRYQTPLIYICTVWRYAENYVRVQDVIKYSFKITLNDCTVVCFS